MTISILPKMYTIQKVLTLCIKHSTGREGKREREGGRGWERWTDLFFQTVVLRDEFVGSKD